MTDLGFTIVDRPDGSSYCVSIDYEGRTVAWTFCWRCKRPVEHCPCVIPTVPDYITRPPYGSEAALRLGVGPSSTGYGFVATRVDETRTPTPAGLNVLSLVDAELVTKIKEAKGEH